MATKYDELREGMDVYDVSNEKVGTVEEIFDAADRGASAASGGGYLRVPTGFLGLGREHHIPFSAIRDVREGSIHLSTDRNQLDDLGYGEAPRYMDSSLSSIDQAAATPAAPVGLTETEGESPRLTEENRRMQLREEQLVARKRSVEAGEVQLNKQVVTEQKTLNVPLTREEVVIERRPVERRPADGGITSGEERITVPLREEQVTVDKQPVVYEEVEIGKRVTQETQQVSDTVRREELRVEHEGDLEVDREAGTRTLPGEDRIQR